MLAASLLALTVCVFAPAQLYFANEEEFPYFFHQAALLLVPLAVLVAAALVVVTGFGPRGWRALGPVLVAAVAAAAWVQSSFLLWSYGVLNGAPIPWEQLRGRGAIDALVWTSLIAGAIAFRRRLGERLPTACAFLIGVELLTLGALALRPRSGDHGFKRYVEDEATKFELSPDRNVIVLVLDTFQSGAFEELLRSEPALMESFPGFTFYRNSVGGFPTTYPSVPLILTGRHYDNQVPIQQFIAEAYRAPTSLPSVLRRAGYRIDLHPLAPPTIDWDAADASRTLRERRGVSWDELGQLRRVALFRCLPHFAKRRLADVLVRPAELVPERLRNVPFIEAMEANATASAPTPVFKYLHVPGVHSPFDLDEQLQPAELSYDLRGYMRQARGVLRLVERFLAVLRKLGVYEQSTVFVVADHGHDLAGLLERATPLMLVKPPGAEGPLEISEAPVSLADIPITAAQLAGLQTWADPVAMPMTEVAPDAKRPRRFLQYTWEHNAWEYRYLPKMQEYVVQGPAWLPDAWRVTGRLFAPGEIIEPAPYRWGTELIFRRTRAVYSFGLYGNARGLARSGVDVQELGTHAELLRPELAVRVPLPFPLAGPSLRVAVDVGPAQKSASATVRVALAAAGDPVVQRTVSRRERITAVVPSARVRDGALPLRLRVSGESSGAAALYRISIRELLPEGQREAAAFQGSGWAEPSTAGTPMRSAAVLAVPIERPPADVQLDATLRPGEGATDAGQVVQVRANGEPLARWRIAEATTQRVTIPRELASRDPLLRLEFITNPGVTFERARLTVEEGALAGAR